MNLNLQNRTTAEIVVLIFSAMIVIVMILFIIGTIILKLKQPDLDTQRVSEAVGSTVNMIVVALVSFISGRAIGKYEEKNGPK